MNNPIERLEPQLVPYALAVGVLCKEWAFLESAARMLFIQAARMPLDRESFGIAHTLDIRDQLSAIKLAFVAKKKDRLVAEFGIKTINYIDNVLRPWRNRFVHDGWTYWRETNSVARFNWNPRIFRPQANEPYDWSPVETAEDELPIILTTICEVSEHAAALADLQFFFHGGGRSVLSKLLRSPPARTLQPRQGVTPDPREQSPAKPKSPPQS